MPEYYEIKVKGQLDQRWSEWFAGLKLTYLEGDVTLLSGVLPDQASLHGLLERIRDLNMVLISVTRGCPSTRNSDRERRTNMAKKVFTHILSEPLHGAKTAKFDISTGTGNLAIDRLNAGDGLLASGSLEYLEKQTPPAWTIDSRDSQAALTLKATGGRQPGFHFPWQACNGETNWQIHINPMVLSDITAHSGGGNVRLDLAGMAITQVSADSGGGNMDVVLPDSAANLSVMARTGGGNVNVEIGSGTTGSNTVNATSGAGNVVISVPSGMATRILASTGLGKVIVDPRFSQVDKNTYQSPDYDSASDKVEITAKSGAGNVSVNTK